MLQTLLVRGVDAKKENAGKKGFKITVEKEDLLRSLEIIKEQSLPRTAFANLGSAGSQDMGMPRQENKQGSDPFVCDKVLLA